MDDSAPIIRLNRTLQGRYRIEGPLGEGGMARVYLAHDERHDRAVALKVLKPEVAALLGAQRFLAEIQTTAKLQHPHILPLFDSGEADGSLFYVMPYVEGETLQERIRREGQLPIDAAVHIAAGVAAALQTAHEAGIVHRDIKPGNILLSRGEPLVADFGIALAAGDVAGSRLTETGLTIGTARYMSPEQVTADEPVGPASDIFSLACVLYEMLVGEPPYEGRSAQARLTSLIRGEPVSAAAVRRSVPAHVDAVLRKALERLPADRFSHAGEFATALADRSFRHGEDAAASSSSGRWRVAALSLGVLSLALGSFGAWALSGADPPAPMLRLSVLLPEPQAGSLGTMMLTADGSALVYEGPSDQAPHQLWVRRWSELNGSPLPGTERGVHPSFSPDGRQVAYMDRGTRQSLENRLMVTPLEGGVPRMLVPSIRGYPRWGRDGNIYYMDVETGGISRVPGAGGAVEQLTERREGDGTPHFSPNFVQEGNAVLFVVEVGDTFDIRSLDLSSREVTTLVKGGLRPHYAPSGHLVYLSRAGDLTAAPFDAAAMKLTGPAVPVAGGLTVDRWYAPMVMAENGSLIYAAASSSKRYQPVWVDRAGAATAIDPGWSFDPGGTLSLSDDGTRLAVSIMGDLNNEDIWVKHLPTGPLVRLTAGRWPESYPRWTRDGRVTFVSLPEGPGALYARAADGTGTAELLLSHQRQIREGLLSPDGQWLIAQVGAPYSVAGAPPGRDVVAVRRRTRGELIPLMATASDEKAISLSPDGNWLAYVSDETGRDEVYVRPFPDVDAGKWTVSVEGGFMPLWSRSGDAIFYVNAAREMVEGRLSTAPSFTVLDRETLFSIGPEFLIARGGLDVSPDDQRFLMLRLEQQERRELILVMNWLEYLEERVPH